MVVVAGGVETLDSELETRRGVLPGLGLGILLDDVSAVILR